MVRGSWFVVRCPWSVVREGGGHQNHKARPFIYETTGYQLLFRGCRDYRDSRGRRESAAQIPERRRLYTFLHSELQVLAKNEEDEKHAAGHHLPWMDSLRSRRIGVLSVHVENEADCKPAYGKN